MKKTTLPTISLITILFFMYTKVVCAQASLNLDQLNRTIFADKQSNIVIFSTPRGVIAHIIPYLFTFSGIILFVMFLWGGFEMLTGATNPKSQEAGKQRIVNALIGFLILFSAFWLSQIVEKVLGISIVG